MSKQHTDEETVTSAKAEMDNQLEESFIKMVLKIEECFKCHNKCDKKHSSTSPSGAFTIYLCESCYKQHKTRGTKLSTLFA